MSIKQSGKCDKCEKNIKRNHFYQNENLCNMCYRRQFVIIPLIEPVNRTISFLITLTESQKKMLDKRVKSLFSEIKNNRKKYLKTLKE